MGRFSHVDQQDSIRTSADEVEPQKTATSRRTVLKAAAAGAIGSIGLGSASAQESATPTASPARLSDERPPNILVLMGDDIGYWNLSAYSLGMMGYQTPNIDRIGREGMIFTDAYGEQSCTAGRAAFITGQSPFRTGLLKIGMPGAEQGLSAEDPTIAQMLKPLGYATGQFGKNHVGDRNEFLPTVHGFDEFFGILYHLNAFEEPENPDYPDDPDFFAQYGPRQVIHSHASDVDDPTEDPRFGRVGKQVVQEVGVLDTERMKTIDEEVLNSTMEFIENAHKNDQPFFTWYNSTRAHIFTHLKDESDGVTGFGTEPDAMVEADGMVGQLLQQLDDLGIADNTIVIYTTDNGAQKWSWPDGSTSPFRGEKNSNWEGAYRVPMLVRWPEKVTAGSICNEIFSLQDWFPTLLAATGIPNIKEQLLFGYQAGDTEFRAHLDGYNQLAMLTEGGPGQRNEFFYFGDDGELVALRTDRWKVYFQVQKSNGLDVWFEPYDDYRKPRFADLRSDPFEEAMVYSGNYDEWAVKRTFVLYPVSDILNDFFKSFVLFPPAQTEATISRYKALISLTQQFNMG